jgi:hypothetical protein
MHDHGQLVDEGIRRMIVIRGKMMVNKLIECLRRRMINSPFFSVTNSNRCEVDSSHIGKQWERRAYMSCEEYYHDLPQDNICWNSYQSMNVWQLHVPVHFAKYSEIASSVSEYRSIQVASIIGDNASTYVRHLRL